MAPEARLQIVQAPGELRRRWPRRKVRRRGLPVGPVQGRAERTEAPPLAMAARAASIVGIHVGGAGDREPGAFRAVVASAQPVMQSAWLAQTPTSL